LAIAAASIIAAAGVATACVALGVRPTGQSAVPGLVLAAILGAVIALAVQLAALRASGRSLGKLLLSSRTVDNLSALPPTLRGAFSSTFMPWLTRSTITADLRRGRDPLDPARRSLVPGELPIVEIITPRARPEAVQQLDERTTITPVDARGRASAPTAPTHETQYTSVRIVFDSGEELAVDGPVYIGRNPDGANAPGGYPVYALPDLSRSLSRTHALIDWTDGLLWVTDLNTTNGTAIVGADGQLQPLIPGLRTAAAIGWRVEFGERWFEIRPGATVS
jgi:hypothetical protein